LKSKEGVYRVDSTKRTPDLGKWNISTDKDHYSALTTWIDSNIADFFELVNQDDAEPMENSLSQNASHKHQSTITNPMSPQRMPRRFKRLSLLQVPLPALHQPPAVLPVIASLPTSNTRTTPKKNPPSTIHQTYLGRYTLHSFFHTPNF
jgi:hypothetical protein